MLIEYMTLFLAFQSLFSWSREKTRHEMFSKNEDVASDQLTCAANYVFNWIRLAELHNLSTIPRKFLLTLVR